ncbi:PDGLE domain-containing protein [Pseudonocardia sp. C8]|uniref:PDGLE domain-containing protein n=1 Tax=Pseudonocardia sp. C8 TaxID=2762759 RepID=UPI001642A551|nr:PDGLE domain-containing protein [Pseudonocardia sp. C8]MBC3192130.1 PDGLE domain-containing protein [Pseudonocardia sp. C8]
MTAPSTRRPALFFGGFLVVALLVAGLLSALASPEPDGLDSVALHGCTVVETPDGAEHLEGTCIAQHEAEHPLSSGPMADYTVGGAEGTTGVAGVTGVIVTVVVAGGVFLLLRRRSG